jgi:NIMA (never in mitosis gene a)-related kinase
MARARREVPAPLLGINAFGEGVRLLLPDGTQVIRKDIPLGARSVETADREMSALKDLHHINIIEYISSEINSSRIQIIMQHADGGDLSKVIKRSSSEKRPLSDDEILQYFHQICFAVRYLHSKGFIHRDLKPENILLTSNGVVKVADVNCSRFVPEDGGGRLGIAGTYPYMAPEMFSSRYDAKVDIWSIGCIFYELCASKRAFSNRIDEVRRAHQRKDLPDMRPMQNRPKSFRNMLRLLLEYDPSKRPTAAQIVRLPVIRAYFDRLVAAQEETVESPPPKHTPGVAKAQGRRLSPQRPTREPLQHGNGGGRRWRAMSPVPRKKTVVQDANAIDGKAVANQEELLHSVREALGEVEFEGDEHDSG